MLVRNCVLHSCCLWLTISSFMILYGCGGKADFAGVESPNSDSIGVIHDRGINPEDLPIVQTFPAGEVIDESVTVDFAKLEAQELHLLNHNYVDKEIEYEQGKRQEGSQSFEQGYPGKSVSEFFQSGKVAKLDLLIVVDNSGTMDEERENFSDKFDSLLSDIYDTDWQIGITQTKFVQDRCLHALLRKSDGESLRRLKKQFKEAINMPKELQVEEGLRSAYQGLTCVMEGEEDTWVREDSTLAVLILSDEDNCNNIDDTVCEDSGGEYAAWRNGDKFINKLSEMRQLGETARVYAITVPPDFWDVYSNAGDNLPEGYDCDTTVVGGHQLGPGVIYEKVVKATGGTSGSVCSDDYSAITKLVSKDLHTLVQPTFELKSPPDKKTVTIKVNDEEVEVEFDVDGKTLKFKDQIIEDSDVEIIYRTGGKPIFSELKLEKSEIGIDPDSIKIIINDQELNNGDYRFKKNENKIKLNKVPDYYAKIQVQFKYKENLNGNFKAHKRAKKDSLVVRVDGKKMSPDSFDFDTRTGSVTFKEPPPEGSKIKIHYKVANGVKLKYKLNNGGEPITSIKVLDAKTDEELSAIIEDGILIIDEEDFVEGREVRVKYRSKNIKSKSVKIDMENVIINSIRLDSATCGRDDYEVSEGALMITCDSMDQEPVTIHYKQGVMLPRRYSIALTQEQIEVLVVVVYINDTVLTNGYSFEGNVLVLEDSIELTASDKISIKAGE